MYRKDKFGNEMYKSSYGKASEKGLEIGLSVPKSKGGTYHLNNLQPKNTKANREKGENFTGELFTP